MKKLLLIALCACALWADSIYFMPRDADSAISHLINELKNAKREVRIAIYSFTNREIAKAIRDSAKRGVAYKIIFDYKQNAKDSRSMIGYLAKLKNIEVCTLQGKLAESQKYNGIMHTKLAIIDDRTIIFGSANWSKSAFELNYEMLLISQNRAYINPAITHFNAAFAECEPY